MTAADESLPDCLSREIHNLELYAMCLAALATLIEHGKEVDLVGALDYLGAALCHSAERLKNMRRDGIASDAP